MTTAPRLERAFRHALELSGDAEVQELQYRDIEEWDSIGHMALIAEIEGEFGVMFSTEQVLAMSSFDKAIELLREQGISDF